MADNVASIEYLVSEIILHLPVKSVVRFKCVSKEWFALISDQKFCHSHTLKLYINSCVIPSALLLAPIDSPTCDIIPLKTINVSGSSNFHNVEVPIGTIIQSCNGLLLIERCTIEDFQELDYFICNPTTNKYVPVIFPTQQFSSSLVSLFIWYEPLKAPYYKLVSIHRDSMNTCILESSFETGYVFNVYSSETNSWGKPKPMFSDPDAECPYYNDAVFFNGAVYWYTSCLKNVCYFDFETLSFKKFPMPSKFENVIVLYFGFSYSNLVFVLLLPSLHIDILKLNVETFEYSVISNVKEWDQSVYCVIVDQENVKDSITVYFGNGKVMSYNLVDSSYEVLFSFSSTLMPEVRNQIFKHYENLSSVGPFNG